MDIKNAPRESAIPAKKANSNRTGWHFGVLSKESPIVGGLVDFLMLFQYPEARPPLDLTSQMPGLGFWANSGSACPG